MRDQAPSEALAAGLSVDDDVDEEPEPPSVDFESRDPESPDVESEDVESEDFESPDLESEDLDSPDFESDPPSLSSRLRPPDGVARRSFFAQPEPLNTTAGATMPFRSVPSAPHSGQNVGADSLIPWRISVRLPHAEHAYR
jgi:hypothetical protein